jgi:hypothetical protein
MYIFVLLAMTFVKYRHPLSGDMGLYYHSKAKDKIPEDEQLNYPFEVRMYGVQIISFRGEDNYKSCSLDKSYRMW